jgi:hypothetical protein
MIDDQNGIGRARRYSIVYGNERLMRAFPAFYLLAAYPPSPFIGASREVAGSPCFPIFPPEGKDVRAAREQSSGKALPFRLSRKKLLWSAEYPIVQEDDRRGQASCIGVQTPRDVPQAPSVRCIESQRTSKP